MRRKILVITTLLLLLVFATAVAVQAKNTKYTFNDVQIEEQIVEIEAGVKETKKSDYSNCNYYTDDYEDFLGYYQEDVSAGDTAEEVLEFCVDHFGDRVE